MVPQFVTPATRALGFMEDVTIYLPLWGSSILAGSLRNQWFTMEHPINIDAKLADNGTGVSICIYIYIKIQLNTYN